jgi:hypothetical protein
MPHNPQPAAGERFALPGHHVLELSGRDAAAFAQAQTMNDVAGLAVGHWHWNGWLTPKGRVVALFALLRLDADTVWLLLPDADAAELAAALQRFVFRSKVALRPRTDLAASGAFAAPAQAQGARFAGDADQGIELDMGGDGGPRTLRIAGHVEAADPQAATAWAAADLVHGLPRLPAAQAGHWTPQQLSLERLRAFSVKKGCYPGQEIVARTHFLGQAKRGLIRLNAGDASLSVGAELREGERAIGTVVCASGAAALAVGPVPREPSSQLHVDDRAVRESPLLGGLAR